MFNAGGFGQSSSSFSGFGASQAQPAFFGGVQTQSSSPFGGGNSTIFGAQQSSSPFGGAQTFGASSSSFGQNNQFQAKGFGQSTLFGQSTGNAIQPFGQQSQPAFGVSSQTLFSGFGQANSGGAIFGQSQSQQQTGLGMFGQPNQQQQSPAFGGLSSPLLGQSQPNQFNQSAGLMQNRTTGSIFGGGQSTGLFGQSALQQQAKPLFGSQQQSQPQSGSGFGSLFGNQSQANLSFGGTGQQANTGQQGTAHTPWQKHQLSESQGNSNNVVYLQSIQAMPAYSSKCAEELRLEDYLQGRKGSQQAPGIGGGSGMGGGIFGQQQNTFSGAGVIQPFSSSQQSSSSIFGGVVGSQSQGSIFGQQQSSGGLFGSFSQPQQNQTNQSLFNTNQGQSGGFGNLFGNTGGAQSQSFLGGAFGQSSSQGLFSSAGAGGGSGLFNTSQASIFPSQQPGQSFSLFGNQQQQKSPAPFGGQPQSSSPIFSPWSSQQQTSGGGMFNFSQSSIFNSQGNANMGWGGMGMSGGMGQSQQNLMFNQNQNQGNNNLVPTNMVMPSVGQSPYGQMIQTLEIPELKQGLSVTNFKKAPSDGLRNASFTQPVKLVNTRNFVGPWRSSSRKNRERRPLRFIASQEIGGLGNLFDSHSPHSDLLPAKSGMGSAGYFSTSAIQQDPMGVGFSSLQDSADYSLKSIFTKRTNPRQLFVKERPLASKDNDSLSLHQTNNYMNSVNESGHVEGGKEVKQNGQMNFMGGANLDRQEQDRENNKESWSGSRKDGNGVLDLSMDKSDYIQSSSKKTMEINEPGTAKGQNDIFKQHLNGLNDQSVKPRKLFADNTTYKQGKKQDQQPGRDTETQQQKIDVSQIPSFKKTHYYTLPNTSQLKAMLQDDPSSVQRVTDFTIGHEHYGSVKILVPIDITQLGDLDEEVEFSRGEVTVYPDENLKPDIGQKLNNKAEVTLLGITKTDKRTGQKIQDLNDSQLKSFVGRLKNLCQTQNAEYVYYDPGKSEWKFRVEHFSRYGFQEDSDTENELDEDNTDFNVYQNDENSQSIIDQGQSQPKVSYVRPRKQAKIQKDYPKVQSSFMFENQTDMSQSSTNLTDKLFYSQPQFHEQGSSQADGSNMAPLYEESELQTEEYGAVQDSQLTQQQQQHSYYQDVYNKSTNINHLIDNNIQQGAKDNYTLQWKHCRPPFARISQHLESQDKNGLFLQQFKQKQQQLQNKGLSKQQSQVVEGQHEEQNVYKMELSNQDAYKKISEIILKHIPQEQLIRLQKQKQHYSYMKQTFRVGFGPQGQFVRPYSNSVIGQQFQVLSKHVEGYQDNSSLLKAINRIEVQKIDPSRLYSQLDPQLQEKVSFKQKQGKIIIDMQRQSIQSSLDVMVQYSRLQGNQNKHEPQVPYRMLQCSRKHNQQLRQYCARHIYRLDQVQRHYKACIKDTGPLLFSIAQQQIHTFELFSILFGYVEGEDSEQDQGQEQLFEGELLQGAEKAAKKQINLEGHRDENQNIDRDKSNQEEQFDTFTGSAFMQEEYQKSNISSETQEALTYDLDQATPIDSQQQQHKDMEGPIIKVDKQQEIQNVDNVKKQLFCPQDQQEVESNPDLLVPKERQKMDIQYSSQKNVVLQKIIRKSSLNTPQGPVLAEYLRRAEFSRWLQRECQRNVEKILENPKENNLEESLDIIIVLLCCNMREAAACLATTSGYSRLGILLLQGGKYQYSKDNFKKQLQQWTGAGYLPYFIPSKLHLIYELLSGEIQNFENTVVDIDWKISLGLHLWYKMSPSSSIQSSFQSYVTQMQHNQSPPPSSFYLGMILSNYNVDKTKYLNSPYERLIDLQYPLIQLYTILDLSTRKTLEFGKIQKIGINNAVNFMQRILCVSGHNPINLDYGFSFILLFTLIAIDIFPQMEEQNHKDSGVPLFNNYMEPQVIEFTLDYHTQIVNICSNLIAYLDILGGKICYMLLVASYIPNHPQRPFMREKILKQILDQKFPYLSKEDLQFIDNYIKIPLQWLQSSKALYASYRQDTLAQIEGLMGAKKYNEAHDVFLRSMAPSLLLSGYCSQVKQIYEQCFTDTKCSQIAGWKRGGNTLEHYLQRVKEGDIQEDKDILSNLQGFCQEKDMALAVFNSNQSENLVFSIAKYK